jgi:hypothetical protein
LLGELIDRMMLKWKCMMMEKEHEMERRECAWISRLKYYAYSAHDTTVAALLCTFGDEQRVVKGGLPRYTASIAVELWQSGGRPQVKVCLHVPK